MRKGSHFTSEQRERITTANRKSAKKKDWLEKNHAAVSIRISALKERWKDPIFRQEQSEERKSRYSKISYYKEKCNPSGDKAHHYRGGVSLHDYNGEFTKALKEEIRKRDNYTCQICGVTQDKLGRKLDVHHIDFFKIHNFPENLISLCKSCHLKLTPRKSFKIFFLDPYNIQVPEEDWEKIYSVLEV